MWRDNATGALAAMSLSWRLSEIEKAIPFNDVRSAWAKNSRAAWVDNTFQHLASITKLAELTGELLDALTPNAIKYLWPDEAEGFGKLKDSCVKIAAGKIKEAAAYKGLQSVRDFLRSFPPSAPTNNLVFGRRVLLRFDTGGSFPPWGAFPNPSRRPKPSPASPF